MVGEADDQIKEIDNFLAGKSEWLELGGLTAYNRTLAGKPVIIIGNTDGTDDEKDGTDDEKPGKLSIAGKLSIDVNELTVVPLNTIYHASGSPAFDLPVSQIYDTSDTPFGTPLSFDKIRKEYVPLVAPPESQKSLDMLLDRIEHRTQVI